MADTEKVHDASSEDPEKVLELTQKSTFGEGELDDVGFKHANRADADEALKAFAGHEGEAIVITPEEERKLLRKIDLNFMPVRHPPKFLNGSANIPAFRCYVLSTGSIILIRLHSHMPVLWDCKKIYIYM